MNSITIALTMGVIFLGGIGVASWAVPRFSGRAFRIAAGLSLGLGLWAATRILGFSAGGKNFTICAEALLTLPGMILLARRGRETMSAPNGAGVKQGHRFYAIVLALMAAGALAAFVIQTLRRPDGDWDAWAIWNVRARLLDRTSGNAAAAFTPLLPQADYPPLLPALVAGIWNMLGRDSLIAPAALAAVFTALVVGVLVAGLAALRGIKPALLAGIVLLGTPQFLIIAQYQIADVPISLYLLTACTLLALALHTSDRQARLAALAGLAASLAALTKNEGQLQFICLGACILCVGGDRSLASRGRLLASFIVGAAPILVLLFFFKHRFAPVNDLIAGTPFSAAIARLHDAHRYLLILRGFLAAVIRVDRWNLFLLALPIVWIVATLHRRVPRAARMIGLALLGILMGYGVVYLLTPHDLHWQISGSVYRLLVQLWPSALLATFLLWSEEPDPTVGN